MTVGNLMFVGGIVGIIISLIAIIICIKVFPKQRKRLLEEDNGEFV